MSKPLEKLHAGMAGLLFAAVIVRVASEVLAPIIPLLVILLVLVSLIAFIFGVGRH